jgi:hypothetical protein
MSDPGFAEIGDIDTAVVVLRFESGALGVIDDSRAAGYGYECSTEVMGRKATVRIDHPQYRHYECPDEREKERIDHWVAAAIQEEHWEGPPTVNSLPARDPDSLTYLAFLADLNVLYQRLRLDSEGLSVVRWLTSCRNAAVAGGGRPPRVLRAGPLPSDISPPKNPHPSAADGSTPTPEAAARGDGRGATD